MTKQPNLSRLVKPADSSTMRTVQYTGDQFSMGASFCLSQ